MDRLDRPSDEEVVVKFEPRVAAGGSGSGRGRGRRSKSGSGGGPGGYRPGQNVICTILKPEPGGYSARIVKDNLPAYLPSNARHNVGDDVLATFVCVDRNRMLLCERFTHGKGELVRRDWESSFDQIRLNDSEEVAQARPESKGSTQSTTNLVMPPIGTDTLKTLRLADYNLDWLITRWEGGMYTGCIRTSSASESSESALLLYRGRAVGCIHCENGSQAKSTEAALQAMLSNLDAPDTVVTMYELPDEIIMAYSALFLGHPVERNDDYNSKEYFEYISNWLSQKHGTATVAISGSEGRDTILCFICEGNCIGSFDVESQLFQEGHDLVDKMVKADLRAPVEVSIIPPDAFNRSGIFGFSLSMCLTRLSD